MEESKRRYQIYSLSVRSRGCLALRAASKAMALDASLVAGSFISWRTGLWALVQQRA